MERQSSLRCGFSGGATSGNFGGNLGSPTLRRSEKTRREAQLMHGLPCGPVARLPSSTIDARSARTSQSRPHVANRGRILLSGQLGFVHYGSRRCMGRERPLFNDRIVSSRKEGEGIGLAREPSVLGLFLFWFCSSFRFRFCFFFRNVNGRHEEAPSARSMNRGRRTNKNGRPVCGPSQLFADNERERCSSKW